MKRLNGWQRIGIILSVLWVIIGGFWTREIVFEELYAPAKMVFGSCLESRSTKDCDAEFQDWSRGVTDEKVNVINAIYTFTPLLLAWLLVYILMRLTRWVRAGF
jgi:hypothetical protein